MSNNGIEIDLPEPVRPHLDAHEKAARRWRLLVTIVSLVTLYSLLHKLLIPLVLKLTVLRSSPYSEVDFFFLYSIAYWWKIHKAMGPTRVLSLLSVGAIGIGLWEVYEVFSGAYTGWLVLSRLLSSIPLAICGIAVLTIKEQQ